MVRLLVCREDLDRRLRGKSATKRQHLAEDGAASLPLPTTPFEAYLSRLAERELLDRQRRATERRIKAAKFPVIKTLDTFDSAAQPSINEPLVRQLTAGEYIDHRENVLLVGNAGTGKTHLATALGFAACTQGRRVRFSTVTGLVTHLLERLLAHLDRYPDTLPTRLLKPPLPADFLVRHEPARNDGIDPTSSWLRTSHLSLPQIRSQFPHLCSLVTATPVVKFLEPRPDSDPGQIRVHLAAFG